jgi:UDP-glucuronate decarboxylase
MLVTGGAGFIGSHLCRRLIGDGHQVLCLDNLFTGSRQNIADLLDHPRFEFVRHDVNQPFFHEVDQIFHLACPASPTHYQRNPVRTITTCVLGTQHALEAARLSGARLLVTSTSEVYGDPEMHPQREEYWGHVNPIGERACYDEGKRCAEALAVAYARQVGLQVRIARIFNTYGPGMHENDGRVVSNFVTQALGGHPMTVYGDGAQTRSLCFVDDLVDALVLLMDSDLDAVPVNLGNPVESTVLELAATIRRLTGSASELVFRPLPTDDPARRCPDITLARERLGWAPSVPLEAGLRRMIADFSRRVGGTADNPGRVAELARSGGR